VAGVASDYGQKSIEELLKYGEDDWRRSNHDQAFSSSSTAAYCLTSGTTGLPKIARIPHSFLVKQSTMIEQRLAARTYQVTQDSAS
jgi:long-subunit acyl-CoA synthetase (AMP-forming)